MSDPTPYTPITLDAIGEATDPFDLRTVSDSIVIECATAGTVTYVLEISTDERTSRAYTTVATYTTSVVKRLRAAMPRFLRVRVTAGTGSVRVGLGKALSADGKLSEVGEESRITTSA